MSVHAAIRIAALESTVAASVAATGGEATWYAVRRAVWDATSDANFGVILNATELAIREAL